MNDDEMLQDIAGVIERHRRGDKTSMEIASIIYTIISTRNFDGLVQIFVGVKWSDAPMSISAYKPEDEKYITKESLYAALMKAFP